jgi:predicted negative regulator of RcsB-dependent stress response
METAIKNGGEKNGVIVEHYGDILFMLNQKDKALEQWKKAVEIGDGSELLGEKIKQQRYLDKK